MTELSNEEALLDQSAGKCLDQGTGLCLDQSTGPCLDQGGVQDVVAALQANCPNAELAVGSAIAAPLLTDFIGADIGSADVYVKVSSTQEVSAALKVAYEHKLPVTVRGAGTNLVGSTIPRGGMVLDVSGMKRVLELDADNRTILVEPGVKLCDLQALVESKGLFYPPDPAEKQATIGGNIATNAGGMRAVKYGVTRDFVLALEVVLPDGTILELGSPCLKDATGLNLKHLFIGSEGSLGVITKCLLRLIAKPEATAHALIGFHSLAEGISAVNTIYEANLAPTAIEFVEKKVIAFGEDFVKAEFPLPEYQAYLVVTFDGKAESLAEQLSACRDAIAGQYQIGFLPLTDPVVAQNVWTIRAALAKAVQASGVWEPVDTVVPLKDIATLIDDIAALSAKEGVRILAFGHAGDGNVHLCILKDDLPLELWPDKLERVLSQLYARVYELRGKVAAEHGVGRHKRQYFLEQVNPDELKLMRLIKHSIDPYDLFNRGCGYAD